MYKQGLALKNLPGMVCRKARPTNKPTKTNRNIALYDKVPK